MTKLTLLLSASCIVLLTCCSKQNIDKGPGSAVEKFKVSLSAGPSGDGQDFKGLNQFSVPVSGLIN